MEGLKYSRKGGCGLGNVDLGALGTRSRAWDSRLYVELGVPFKGETGALQGSSRIGAFVICG